jgi:hypothetical protein
MLLSRADVVKRLSYSVTGSVLRLSEETSKAAGYLDLVDPDATPLVPAFAVALRREIFTDAQILSQSVQGPIEIHTTNSQREWMVGRIVMHTAIRLTAAHEAAFGEIQGKLKPESDLEKTPAEYGVGSSVEAEGR